VVKAMQHFAELTTQARKAILDRDHAELSRRIDENFDTRLSICQLPVGQVRMVETARRLGASAKFAGSGGAIIGTLSEKTSYEELQHAMTGIGCHTIRA